MKVAGNISANRTTVAVLIAAVIFSLAASLVFSTGAQAKSFKGTNKADRIVGTAAADSVKSRDGNDRVYGRAGNDAILGGRDNDQLFGKEGNDLINGGLDNDRVYGQAGNDRLLGGIGRDFLAGQNGNDIINTGNDNDPDTVACGAGSDVAYVQTNDVINSIRVSQITADADDLIDDCEVLVIDGVPLPVAALLDIPESLLRDIVLGNDLSLIQLLQLQGIVEDNSDILGDLGLLDLVEALLEDLIGDITP